MKVYIDSEDKELGIAVANLLNRRQNMNAIIAETEIESYEDLVQEAKDNANRGFDYVLVLSSDPYKAGIDINKSNYARAVACRTRTDVDAACKAANANVIVLDSTKGRAQIAELVEEFSDVSFGGTGNEGAKEASEEEEKENQVKNAVKNILGSFGKASYKERNNAATKKKQSKKKDIEEEEEEPGPEGKKGFFGSIKNALGIE
ncbi:MAG: hypothetical protein ACP5NE_00020 [Candidatus Micrarchaeia archaeon]